MISITYKTNPIMRIEKSPIGGIEAKLNSRNFEPLSKEGSLTTFRRYVSNPKTALIFALTFLEQNAKIPLADFEIHYNEGQKKTLFDGIVSMK